MLPDSVGNLVQLRYLDLSNTRIKSLPSTTCNLYNLQTLILSNSDLTELPMHIGKLVNLRHLDISKTNLKEMPMQIVGLENLRTLTVFIVGKQQVGLSIRELRKFPHLQGKLSIKNLHNVMDAMEASDANMENKDQIEKLVLEWGKQTEDSQTVKVVLDMLQPSANLKKLIIKFYCGTSFPSWLGDSSFSKMVSLRINNCKYCVTLPPLGQLPSLKDLRVSGMTLETIGPEFYGMAKGGSISSFQPFPSLEHLEFVRMSNWKEWLSFEIGEFPFPRLKTLELHYFPELRGYLPSHLSSIEKIIIFGCDHLLATPHSLHWLSSIKTIDIDSQWSWLESDSPCMLQDLKMGSCDKLLSLPKMILSSNCLQHLLLYDIPSLTAFSADGLPTSLMSLHIDECKNLAFLRPETWSNYRSLVTLGITESCNSLMSFPFDGFPMLQSLPFDGCRSLESIFISKNSSLCPSSLQRLQVCHCKALRLLDQRMDTLTALEHLSLENLPKLELSFCEGACLPSKLQYIKIHPLPPMPVMEWGHQSLTALSKFYVGSDDIVNTLLKGQLLPICLVSLSITDLTKMKSLEENGLRRLSSLETLEFVNCPGLESLQEARLPSSLKSLIFESCPELESLPEERLPSSLEKLTFYDCPRLESLPEDMLPPSIKLLSIDQCPLLEVRYESQRGKHWSNIAHIPVIEINYETTIL